MSSRPLHTVSAQLANSNYPILQRRTSGNRTLETLSTGVQVGRSAMFILFPAFPAVSHRNVSSFKRRRRKTEFLSHKKTMIRVIPSSYFILSWISKEFLRQQITKKKNRLELQSNFVKMCWMCFILCICLAKLRTFSVGNSTAKSMQPNEPNQ